MAIVVQGSTTDFKQRMHGRTIKGAQRMLFELQRRPLVAEEDAQAGDVGTIQSERNSSLFSVCIELPYLRLHCSRLPDDCGQVQLHIGVRERRSSRHKITKGALYGAMNIGEGWSWLG